MWDGYFKIDFLDTQMADGKEFDKENDKYQWLVLEQKSQNQVKVRQMMIERNQTNETYIGGLICLIRCLMKKK